MSNVIINFLLWLKNISPSPLVDLSHFLLRIMSSSHCLVNRPWSGGYSIYLFFISLFISRIKFQPPRFHQHFFSGYFRWAQHGRGYAVGMSCGSQPLHPVSKKTRRVGRESVWRKTLKVFEALRWNLNVLEWREWALFNGRWMFESKRNPESEGL